MQLESNLAREQENQVNKLLKRIDKLEKDTQNKQCSLEQVKNIEAIFLGKNINFLIYFVVASRKS